MMLILATAAPYISWGEPRAKLLRRLLYEKFDKNISSYQVHRMLLDAHIDVSIGYVKKLLGDMGKNNIAEKITFDKALSLCKALSIEPNTLIPVFEIQAPVDFVDPVELDTYYS